MTTKIFVAEYNDLFRKAYEMYGNTEDMQLLELLELKRNEFRSEWGLPPL